MNDDDDRQARTPQISWGLIIWALLGIYLLFYLLSPGTANRGLDLTYSQFLQQLDKGNIQEVVIRGDAIQGSLKQAMSIQRQRQTFTSREFRTVRPPFGGDQLLQRLQVAHVNIKAESTKESWWSILLITLVPWLLLIGFFIFMSRRAREGMSQGGFLNRYFKSGAKLYRKEKTAITFQDVAGLQRPKQELEEIVDFLRAPRKYSRLGGRVPHGVLLVGPPGTGKTMLARAVAGEANVPFYSISGSEFIEMFVGVGASRVRDLFTNAKREAPAIIFIDEIDSIGRTRGATITGSNEEREQTLNQILAEMDGFSPNESMIVMAATNRPDILDPALTRPGRFDREVVLELPTRPEREAILRIHTRSVILAEDVDFDHVARGTVGFSGADLANLVNEAALLAAREGKQAVEMLDFETARDKILLGVEREDLTNEHERELTAYHESGHALLAQIIPEADPPHKVTIIPRGRSMGATEQLPEEDRHSFPESYLLAKLVVSLGGRAAEELVFGDVTSGAQNDLKVGTEVARRMVTRWGMSKKLGPVAYVLDEEGFLQRDLPSTRTFSENTAMLIDQEVKRIVEESYARALHLLARNRDKLDRLAHALLEKEVLGKEDLDRLAGLGSSAGQRAPRPLKPPPEGRSPEDRPHDQPAAHGPSPEPHPSMPH
ncbi:MAG: ATP-dependent zinc metalloprotease FtsH [Pseudomonadota bacterium]